MAEVKESISYSVNVKVKRPSLYMVIMHNDEDTTQEFVIRVLSLVFGKEEPQAMELMLKVHNQGHAVIGVYPYDIAKTKVQQAEQMAKLEKFPLQCSFRKVD